MRWIPARSRITRFEPFRVTPGFRRKSFQHWPCIPLPARKHTNPKRKRGRQVLSSLALRVGMTPPFRYVHHNPAYHEVVDFLDVWAYPSVLQREGGESKFLSVGPLSSNHQPKVRQLVGNRIPVAQSNTNPKRKRGAPRRPSLALTLVPKLQLGNQRLPVDCPAGARFPS